MLWFRDTKRQMQTLHRAVRDSFSGVKQDIQVLYQWVQYLSQKLNEQQQQNQYLVSYVNYHQQMAAHMNSRLVTLNQNLETIPKKEEIVLLIKDELAVPFGQLQVDLRSLQNQLEEFSRRSLSSLPSDEPTGRAYAKVPVLSENVQDAFTELEKRLKKVESKKLTFQEKMMKRLTKTSNDYIVTTILKYIQKYESLSGTKLKEIIVDELALCSKSSFYRILAKIEPRNDVGVIKKGKEKHYFTKAIKQDDYGR